MGQKGAKEIQGKYLEISGALLHNPHPFASVRVYDGEVVIRRANEGAANGRVRGSLRARQATNGHPRELASNV